MNTRRKPKTEMAVSDGSNKERRKPIDSVKVHHPKDANGYDALLMAIVPLIGQTLLDKRNAPALRKVARGSAFRRKDLRAFDLRVGGVMRQTGLALIDERNTVAFTKIVGSVLASGLVKPGTSAPSGGQFIVEDAGQDLGWTIAGAAIGAAIGGFVGGAAGAATGALVGAAAGFVYSIDHPEPPTPHHEE